MPSNKKLQVSDEELNMRPTPSKETIDAWASELRIVDAAPGEARFAETEQNQIATTNDITASQPHAAMASKAQDVVEAKPHDAEASKGQDVKASKDDDAKVPQDQGAKTSKGRKAKAQKSHAILAPRRRVKTGPGTRQNPRLDSRTGREKVVTSVHFIKELLVMINQARAPLQLSLSDFVMVACAEKLGIKALPEVEEDAEGEGDAKDAGTSLEKTG